MNVDGPDHVVADVDPKVVAALHDLHSLIADGDQVIELCRQSHRCM